MNDNLEAAMHDEASRTDLTIKSNIGTTPGNPANRQVLIRAIPEDHDRWKAAATKLGLSVSEYIRQVANEKAAELLDCQHPNLLRYPWAVTCLDCGTRLWEQA